MSLDAEAQNELIPLIVLTSIPSFLAISAIYEKVEYTAGSPIVKNETVSPTPTPIPYSIPLILFHQEIRHTQMHTSKSSFRKLPLRFRLPFRP